MFSTNPLDDKSKEFYDEIAALYQLIKGCETMLGASIKCIALPLAEELHEKLLALENGFTSCKGYEKNSCYLLVCDTLEKWPKFAGEEVAVKRKPLL